MLLVWSALFALAYRAIRGWQPAAIVTVAALVFSHYVLDVITHRPDLPITLTGSRRLGLGLWNYPGATLALESALFIVGTTLYMSVTRARDRIGRIGFWSLIVVARRDLLRGALRPAAAERSGDRRRRASVVVVRDLGVLGRSASHRADAGC